MVHTNEQNVWEGNMELKELIKYARDNRCSDLHITAGEAVAVRKYGELELLDITYISSEKKSCSKYPSS